jgi:Na+/glutamate symporter
MFMTFPETISQYWKLEKLQFKGNRFIIALAIQTIIWALLIFWYLHRLFLLRQGASI